jgi:uncharacterized protein
MANEDGMPGWQALCRRQAQLAALAEARDVWELEIDEPIPFNHRWEHVQHVVALALWLARACGGDLEVVEAAAWLHDVRKQAPKHARAGAEAARSILAKSDFPAEKIEAVAQVIAVHEGLTRPAGAPPMQPLEAAILWDADKLSKLGVQALAFSLSTVYVEEKSLAERRREIEEFVQEVLARTVTSMNTAPAHSMAERRYQAMVQMLALWAQEEHEV